jgi:hypothetical protein
LTDAHELACLAALYNLSTNIQHYPVVVASSAMRAIYTRALLDGRMSEAANETKQSGRGRRRWVHARRTAATEAG